MYILSLFTHPNTSLKNVGNQIVSIPLDKKTIEINGNWKILVTNILQNKWKYAYIWFSTEKISSQWCNKLHY